MGWRACRICNWSVRLPLLVCLCWQRPFWPIAHPRGWRKFQKRRTQVKLGTVNHQGKPALVVKQGENVVLLSPLYASAGLGTAPDSMNAMIEGGAGELARARKALEHDAPEAVITAPDWLAPAPRPSK